jgi:hypothetical protein
MFIRKRIIGILAVVLVALGTIAGLSACSGGSSSSTPQNATQILQSDGYTPSSAYTSALQGGLGSTSGEVTSSQVGTNGGNVQAVIVFDNATDEQAGATGIQGQFTGLNSASSGDVLTVTGPLTAWASAGG